MYSAYRRGKIDLLLSSVSLVFIAFPALIAVIAVLSFWQPGSEIKVIIVLGVTSIPIVYRVIRAATLSAANQDYILAAKVQGATDRRILLRELLPNVAPTGLSFLMLGIASIIGVQGTLAFLGIQQGEAPNWGEMINESRSSLDQSPWLAIFPSIALVLLILSLNFVGDRFRARFDVTEVKI
jgi:peptide/nickel transport system permease protein